ncbi:MULTISPECIES: hypothetical protein [unclassified Enterococcus]|uniref:hypothetical protein n=1 Tax=unclassified Enterococcus TaxID=2608891 RepID=UPI001BCE6E11|nr:MULTISPECIES: hypothetical protein [unclassified Enterococcus]MBS7577599.1 hypothetical protein [Enterococcus sp. MMGLQ5-2]MBS7584902.1 hypothetical protein [Enterococcus sp. MMGLQ5-1]
MKKNQQLNDYIFYDYKEITVDNNQVSLYLDGYENFGWEIDQNVPFDKKNSETTLRLKRNRKIINKVELTRLQRNFESNLEEIQKLEKSKNSLATSIALFIAVLGTAFMAGSVFAVTHQPPIIWLSILLAIPGFIGWISPYFIYKIIYTNKAKKIQSYIDEKYENIYRLCEKGYSLL